jgi:hypothetical protein
LGFFLPAKPPIEIAGKVHADTVTALADPAIRTKLEEGGAVVTGSTLDALASFLHSEMEKWGAVIKEANIKPMTRPPRRERPPPPWSARQVRSPTTSLYLKSTRTNRRSVMLSLDRIETHDKRRHIGGVRPSLP